MLGAIFNAIGILTVTEDKNLIRVRGINGHKFEVDVQNQWNTSKIYSHIFRQSSGYGFELDSFFAVDLLYVLQKIVDNRGKLSGSRRQYISLIENLKQNTWLRTIENTIDHKLDFSALNRLRLTLFEHQMNFLKVYDDRSCRYRLNGYILGAAPGSGKTITNYALSECLNTDTTIIIVPKNSVDRVWKDTILTLFKETPTYWISSSGEPITPGRRYYIAHYEQLDNVLHFARKTKLGRVNIVLDESHNFNDVKSARTQALCDLVKATKSVSTIFASGTPVKAMGSEVIPILRCIDPFFFPWVEERFKKVFGLSTSRALDILANRMGLITFKVDKAVTVGNQVDTYEVKVKTPTGMEYTLDKIRAIMSKFIEERMKYYKDNLKMFHEQYFNALNVFESTLRSSEDWADYKKYRNYASTLNKGYDQVLHVQEALYCNAYEKNKIIPALPQTLKEIFKNAKSVYKYYHLKVQGEALGRILGKMRTQCNVDMVCAMDNYEISPGKLPLCGQKISLEEIINQGKKKTVIFTSYVEVVGTVDKLLKERGFNPVLIYGDTNKNLAALIDQFEKNPDLNPIVATFPSLSTAVPLVMANQAVMLNAPFRIHEYEQAVSRMDRIGQTEIVNVFNIFLDTGNDVNISTRSVDIMAWSKSQVDAIMGISTPTSMVGIESMSDVDLELITEIALEHCDNGDTHLIPIVKQEVIKRKLGW